MQDSDQNWKSHSLLLMSPNSVNIFPVSLTRILEDFDYVSLFVKRAPVPPLLFNSIQVDEIYRHQITQEVSVPWWKWRVITHYSYSNKWFTDWQVHAAFTIVVNGVDLIYCTWNSLGWMENECWLYPHHCDTRRSDNDNTPQPIDHRMGNPLLGLCLLKSWQYTSRHSDYCNLDWCSSFRDSCFASTYHLAHENREPHMRQIRKWPWCCTATGPDNSTELWTEKIHPAVSEICFHKSGPDWYQIWGVCGPQAGTQANDHHVVPLQLQIIP